VSRARAGGCAPTRACACARGSWDDHSGSILAAIIRRAASASGPPSGPSSTCPSESSPRWRSWRPRSCPGGPSVPRTHPVGRPRCRGCALPCPSAWLSPPLFGCPASGLMTRGLPAVARLAQSSAVLRVVSVQALSLQLLPRLGPVVRLGGRRAAAQHAHGLSVQHAAPEPVLVPLAVPALAGSTAAPRVPAVHRAGLALVTAGPGARRSETRGHRILLPQGMPHGRKGPSKTARACR